MKCAASPGGTKHIVLRARHLVNTMLVPARDRCRTIALRFRQPRCGLNHRSFVDDWSV
jgi:hypothetical protein